MMCLMNPKNKLWALVKCSGEIMATEQAQGMPVAKPKRKPLLSQESFAHLPVMIMIIPVTFQISSWEAELMC